MNDASSGTSSRHRDPSPIALIGVGCCLVGVTIAIAYASPTTYATAHVPIMILGALGGGMIGSAVPGVLGLEVRGMRAAGAIALVVLFFLFAPGSVWNPTEPSTKGEAEAPVAPPASPKPLPPAPESQGSMPEPEQRAGESPRTNEKHEGEPGPTYKGSIHSTGNQATNTVDNSTHGPSQ